MHIITVDSSLDLTAPSTSGFSGFSSPFSSTAPIPPLPDFTGFVGLKNTTGATLTVHVPAASAITSQEQVVLLASTVKIPDGETLYLPSDCASTTIYPLTLAIPSSSGSLTRELTLSINGRVGSPRITTADSAKNLLEVWASCHTNGVALMRSDLGNDPVTLADQTAIDGGQDLQVSATDTAPITLSVGTATESVSVTDQTSTTLTINMDSATSLLTATTRAVVVAPGASMTLNVDNQSGVTIYVEGYSIDSSTGTLSSTYDYQTPIDKDATAPLQVTLDDSSHYLSIWQKKPPVAAPEQYDEDSPTTAIGLWDDPVVVVKHSGRGTVSSGSSGG